jgi:hypothetical protein
MFLSMFFLLSQWAQIRAGRTYPPALAAFELLMAAGFAGDAAVNPHFLPMEGAGAGKRDLHSCTSFFWLPIISAGM